MIMCQIRQLSSGFEVILLAEYRFIIVLNS